MIISETCVGLVIPVVVCLEPASLHVVVVVVVVLLLALRSCICCSFRLIDKLLLHLCLCPCVSLQNLCLGSCTFGMGLLESVSLHVVGVAVMVLLLVLRGCICCSFSLVHGLPLHLSLGSGALCVCAWHGAMHHRHNASAACRGLESVSEVLLHLC